MHCEYFLEAAFYKFRRESHAPVSCRKVLTNVCSYPLTKKLAGLYDGEVGVILSVLVSMSKSSVMEKCSN